MSRNAVEKIAISTINEALVITEFLDPFLKDGDKEPAYDGSVYIYDNKSNEKANAKKVNVQVKGKTSRVFNSDSVRYSLQIEDLKIYLSNGGCIFFVVLLSEDKRKKSIYYNALTPVKIKGILEQIKTGAKTKSVVFEKFPEDNRAKVNLFYNFFIDSRKQMSFINCKLPSLNEFRDHNREIEIVNTINGYGYSGYSRDFFLNMIGQESYLYEKRNEILIPLADVVKLLEVNEEIQQKVEVNKKTYYTSYVRVQRQKDNAIRIGKSIELKIMQNRISIGFKMPSTLFDRIKDIEFVIAAFENERFSINDIELDISASNTKGTSIDLVLLRNQLEFCNKIQQLFGMLNITENLDLSKLTKCEELHLCCLVQAFIDGEAIKLKKTGDSRYIYMKIQQLIILIYAKEENEGSYKYRFHDIFREKWATTFEESMNGKAKELYPVYSVLTKVEYEKVSNIDYNGMVEEYRRFAINNPNVLNQANLDVLQMLLAYDICEKELILKTAIEIMQWILSIDVQEEVTKNVYMINYLQAITRSRALKSKEEEILIDMLTKKNVGDEINFAAYVLLKQKKLAKAHLRKINPKDVEVLRDFPIYNLFEKLI